MPIDSVHPYYENMIDYWITQRDCESGEIAIKEKGDTYLPMPDGFGEQKDKGVKMYAAYKIRAQFPDLVQPTLQGMVGVIHRVEAQIEGLEENKPLSRMWEKATNEGLPLESFHRRITSDLLLMGRYSILTDVPSTGDGAPYLAGYGAEQLINWSDPDREMFVLNESRKVRSEEEFSWNDAKIYRALRLKDGVYTVQVYTDGQPGELITPQLRGGKKVEEIPIVVVGPRDLSLETVQPPLYGVSKAALATYRLDADYRHQLFNTGQETFIVIGETENLPKVIGSGVIFGLPANCDAKFVTPTGVGINAHRQAILDERQNAVAAGVKLFDQAKAESGEALRLRSAAQTATLTTIALASAAALEKALRYAAMYAGQDPAEIIVKPNLQFMDTKMDGLTATQLVTVWQSGAISKQTLYDNLQKGEIASTERTFEEEEDLIKQEILDDPTHPANPANLNNNTNQQQDTGAGGADAPAPRSSNSNLNGGSNAPASRFVETGDGILVTRQ